MNLYVATFHHRTLPPVRWHIPASSFVAALAQACRLADEVLEPVVGDPLDAVDDEDLALRIRASSDLDGEAHLLRAAERLGIFDPKPTIREIDR